MPSLVHPPTPVFIEPPPTKENLDFANLAIVDLSKYHSSDGKAELIETVKTALSTIGFFYVINHGYTQEQRNRIFDIANIPFTQVSDEDKQKYLGRMKETGSYQGYKLRQYWHIDAGVRDQLEHYNLNRNVFHREHPEALRPFVPELDAFVRFNHFNVLLPLLRLLALGLELPEDTFVKMHNFDVDPDVSDSWLRFMKYYPRSEEEEVKTKNVWLKGHVDFGTLTLLWSQPVSALQILGPDGVWKWVKHLDNALVVNAGEAMEMLSGGFYKGTIHRVVQPPVDQRHLTRLGVFYFVLADDHVKLVPLQQSPVLQRIGIKRRCDDAVAPTMGQYRKGRIAAYGQSVLKPGKDKGVEEEVIGGVVVKHYN
ncbi:hypothetical protein AMATHDRAFT_77105 [Amanita thiersii Skay4041]|uniref:Fe2OG dioxygenase domain-containing protein n=1 Tax=Amanita thiersii Skay4041 TaxID=703135 RepID=A0A2A9NE88_9AGAR|nr:hypothetical protein AMATHDRAFT_77105 [Amanita thiersii Skay4041]